MSKKKNITVRRTLKTHMRGKVININADPGVKVFAMANLRYPRHDRAAWEAVKKYLAKEKPDIILLLGRMFDHNSFESLVFQKPIEHDDCKNENRQNIDEAIKKGLACGLTNEHELCLSSEDARVAFRNMPDEMIPFFDIASEEQRFAAWGKHCGQFLIDEIVEVSGCKAVYFLPGSDAGGDFAGEGKILRYIRDRYELHLDVARQLSRSRRRKGESDRDVVYPKRPPESMVELLKLQEEPRIYVHVIGGGIEINERNLFLVGDNYKSQTPITALFKEWERRKKSIVRGYNGQLCSLYFTTPGTKNGSQHREYWQLHQIGHLFDVEANHELGDTEFYAQGFFSCVIGYQHLFGSVTPIFDGKNGKPRFFTTDSEIYDVPDLEPVNREVVSIAPKKASELQKYFGDIPKRKSVKVERAVVAVPKKSGKTSTRGKSKN